ncbi:MAG: TauD/TfdA family dioxygenase [Cyclobacteriaceae bacterium]
MKNNLLKLRNIKPASIEASAKVVTHSLLEHENGSIPIIRCHTGLDIQTWASDNTEVVNSLFDNHGVVLLRGFNISEEIGFYNFTRQFTQNLMDYTESSTPRTRVGDKVYTSTEYPKDEHIPMHNEHSYSTHWPQKVWFHCVTPATTGGETPLADSRKVLAYISPETVEKFRKKGVMYVRNYGSHIDLHWKSVYNVETKDELEAYCLKNGIQFEWTDKGLRTRQVCQGLFTHPEKGAEVWFNQAHLFHMSNLAPHVQEYLLSYYGKEGLPRNTYYGDGSEIEPEVLTEIRNAFNNCLITFDWQKNDVVMVDNVLYAHGRFPFDGPRKVLVAMADPYHHQFQQQ